MRVTHGFAPAQNKLKVNKSRNVPVFLNVSTVDESVAQFVTRKPYVQ
jgi:hypothetical protein